MSTVAGKVRSALRWMLAVRIVVQAVTWASTVVIIRLLQPEDYGLLAIAMVFIGFVGMFSELGLSTYLIQRPTIDDTSLRQVFGFILVSNFSIAAISAGCAPLVADFFNDTRASSIIVALSAVFLMAPLQTMSSSILSRSLAFGRASIVDGIAAVFSSVVGLALAYSGYGVWSLVIGTLVATLVRAIGYQILHPIKMRPEFSLRAMREVAGFGTSVLAQRVLYWFHVSIDTILLGRMFSKEVLGFYNVGNHLAGLPEGKLGEMVTTLSFAGLARVADDVEKRTAYLKKSLSVLATVSLPVSVGMALTAVHFIPLIVGERWMPSIPILQMLAIAYAFRIYRVPILEGMNAIGHPHRCMVAWGMIAVITGIGVAIGIRWGIEGVALAWLIVAPATLIGVVLLASGVLAFGMLDFAESIYKPALSVGAMAGAVLLVRFGLGTAVPSVPGLIAEVLVGAGIFGLSMLVFDRATIAEIFQIAGVPLPSWVRIGAR